MAHTPTPWNAHTRYAFDKEGNCIVICDTDNASPKRMEANAAFIVKAVNAHDELTEAVELLLTCVYAGYAPGNPTSDEAIAKGQAALAKAGELK